MSNTEATAVRSNNSKLKAVAALLVIVALVSLAFIAIKTKGDKTTTTTKGALAFVQSPRRAAVTQAAPVVGRGNVSPLVSEAGETTADQPQPPIVGGGGSVNPAAPTDPGDDGPVNAQLTCPAPLPAATHSGGLANVSGIVPLFGPFSAEAFTFVPALTPAFPVLGPFFPVFEAMIAAGQPLLDTGVPVVNQLETAGFDALAPLYAPVRPQILAGEAQAAAGLSPLVEQLATTPGTGCVADVADILASLLLVAF